MTHTLIANNFRDTLCPLCMAENIHKVGDISYLQPIRFSTKEIELEVIPELWKCSACDSSFVQNRVPESMAISLYSQGESAGRWSGNPFTLQKPTNQIGCLAKYFLKGKKVLDIGCNTGELLDYAKTLGCETAGVEYSKSSRRVLEKKRHLAFSSMFEVTQKFDVVTAFDLVEHLYDVPAFFHACRNMLKKDGMLIILTGNIGSLSARLSKARWWYLKYPEHIVFPSKKYCASCAGYEIHEWIKTYASTGYQHPVWYSIRRARHGILDGTFTGLPSIGPDHILAVMKRVD